MEACEDIKVAIVEDISWEGTCVREFVIEEKLCYRRLYLHKESTAPKQKPMHNKDSLDVTDI